MQVDPIKPVLKAPGTMRLKRECGKLLSSFAFNSNLRRYNEAENAPLRAVLKGWLTVGRCRLNR